MFMISLMKGIIETHCHLDYLKELPLQDTIEQSKAAGIEAIITVAVSPDNQAEVLNISKKYDMVFCTQGIHPHEAKEWSPQCQQTIIQNLRDPNVKAIGEIGLDYHYDNSPRDIQRDVFEAQLQIAIDNNLPIIVHTREAEEDTMAILKNFESHITSPVVFHCYTSSQDLAEYAISRDHYLGFNGIITFKAAQNVRDILKMTPLENIVIETDAPYLSPIPFRGRENSPIYLPHIANKISEEKSIPIEELLEKLNTNSVKLFALEVS